MLSAFWCAAAGAAHEADGLLSEEAPTVTAVDPTVNITIFVEGTVMIYVSRSGPNSFIGGSSSLADDASTSSDELEIMYTLVDKNVNSDELQLAADDDVESTSTTTTTTGSTTLRVDFGEQQALSLTTGDTVLAPITLQLPASLAEQLGGMLASGWSDVADGDAGRRLLSINGGGGEEQQEHQEEAARRMVLEWHNTRRSVQEFVGVRNILDAMRISNRGQAVRSEMPVLTETGAGKDLFIVDGKPQEVSSLTFVFRSSSCGLTPALNAARVRQQWFNNGGTNLGANLETYHSVCTYNQLTFKPANNLVFDVDIPCVGNTTRGPYNLKTGYSNGANLDNEVFGLTELAKKWLKAVLGCSTDTQDCYTWLSPRVNDTRLNLVTVFKELGHNIGLPQSQRILGPTSDCDPKKGCTPPPPVGDLSCAMGYNAATDNRTFSEPFSYLCMNAPQSYLAGWSNHTPGGIVMGYTDFNSRAGTSRDFILPSASTAKDHILRIVNEPFSGIGWFTGNASSATKMRSLYLSYRTTQTTPSQPSTYDAALGDPALNLDGRVWYVKKPPLCPPP
ncbi:hypothetical protein PLESTF_001803300 [Pleodorina starrii]|nr:hypothetical protein PLESTF_001803300 [Pleodorina starrii]